MKKWNTNYTYVQIVTILEKSEAHRNGHKLKHCKHLFAIATLQLCTSMQDVVYGLGGENFMCTLEQ